MTEAATEKAQINRSGITGLAVTFILILLTIPILFFSAGTWGWLGAWVYVGLALAYQVVYLLVLTHVNPAMLNERGKFAKSGTKGFDRDYFIMYLPITIGGLVLIALDRRYGWTTVPFWAHLVGVALLLVSFVPGLWALMVNPYFECTVRIQKDRGQTVIKNGPYRFIRHPGYLGLVLSLAAVPLILGSWWGFVPYGFMILVVITRTALEDKTLQKELPGYREYTAETRYRLIPFIW